MKLGFSRIVVALLALAAPALAEPLTLPREGLEDRLEFWTKVSTVRQALDEIAYNLDAPENLSLPAKQIREAILFRGIPLSSDALTELRKNIHTQRGIKERFRQGIVRSGKYVDT